MYQLNLEKNVILCRKILKYNNKNKVYDFKNYL